MEHRDVAECGPFDAEWYLRKCGEDELLDHHEVSTLSSRARALIAVDLIAPAVAARVVDDYARARSHRGVHPHVHAPWQDLAIPSTAARSLDGLTISPCDRSFEPAWGTLTIRAIAFDEDRTSLLVHVDPAGRHSANSGQAHRRYVNFMQHPPTLTITDDQGKTHRADFNGGEPDEAFTGEFAIRPPLSRDIQSITLFGERIPILPPPDDIAVKVIEQPADRPLPVRARRYLARCLDYELAWDGEPQIFLPIVIETLVAAQALDPKAPIIGRASAVQDAVHRRGVHRPRQPRTPRNLPKRWRSILARRGRHDGVVGARVVGAAAPIIDGLQIAVLRLEAKQFDFTIHIRAVAAGETAEGLSPPMIGFRARDDRGNYYVGSLRNMESAGGAYDGSVSFGAPVDPQATSVDLIFVGDRSKAVMHVPLVWSARPEVAP